MSQAQPKGSGQGSDYYESGGDSSDGWEEMEDESEAVKCLFCENVFKSFEQALDHLQEGHKFNLLDLSGRYAMDQYSYIRMVNFVIREKRRPEEIMGSAKCLWSNDINLRPVDDERRNWLTFDFEYYIEEMKRKRSNESASLDDKDVILRASELQTLQDTLKSALKRNQEMEEANKQLQEIVENLRKSALAHLEDEKEQNSKPARLRDDESYFTSYSHYGIHQEMLCDEVRTLSYREAIEKNRASIQDKIVMDLGCGTGILSMFAARAQAKHVISVDQSDIIYQAMDIARRNNFGNVKFLKGRIEEVSLPHEKVDVIVSEWMGYFLLFEGMLDSVIYARDHYLSPEGIMLPNRCTISLIGSGDVDRHRERISFWESVYGFDMSSMKDDVLREASVEICRPEMIITEPNTIADFNLMTVDTSCYAFAYDFSLRVLRSGVLTSLVGYFDTFFDLPTQLVSFSTGPHAEPTHWKQVVFFLPTPLPVTSGDTVSGKFQCQRNPQDTRSLLISIHFHDQVLEYNFM
ncbi:protein arginine N-methyltransferase 1 [Phlebotomus argentipes]|uniref:protein arginine N-methyltransferase 1 n=1 Tax=Phlebotomus argentipes TaxID=94469 RepID=UPI002893662A|nr:protein arginine N-methyltransferase 1 [Phlebotomus argentipes]